MPSDLKPKPCPFCGSKPGYITKFSARLRFEPPEKEEVCCPHHTLPMPVDYWNQRFLPASVRRLIKAASALHEETVGYLAVEDERKTLLAALAEVEREVGK